MGAWIEMLYSDIGHAMQGVAPYMGAWIEITLKEKYKDVLAKSLPTWERGLKSALLVNNA